MPIEFSAPPTGSAIHDPPNLSPKPIDDRLPIFAKRVRGLVGFRKFPSNWAIDWRLFFDSGNNPPALVRLVSSLPTSRIRRWSIR